MAVLLVERDFALSGEADVGVLARAAGLAVAAVGENVVLPGVAGYAVHVRPAPRVDRQRLLQVRLDRHEPFLRGRVAALFQPVLVEGLLEGIDLRPRHLGLGLPDLREVARGDVAGEQADDHDHDQKLKQREADLFGLGHVSSPYCAAQTMLEHTPPPEEPVPLPVVSEPPPPVKPVPLTPSCIAGLPPSWAPMSGAAPLKPSLKFGMRTPLSYPGLLGA